MRLDIHKAGLVSSDGGIITKISTTRQGFKIEVSDDRLFTFASVMDLCRDLGIRPEALRAAVEAEGCEIDGHDIRPLAQSQERPHSRSMRVSLEGAGLTTKSGSSLAWILAESRQFQIGVTNDVFFWSDSVDDLCQDLGVDEEALRAAVLAKGYEIVEGDICPVWIDGSLLTDSERAAIAVAATRCAPVGVDPHLWTVANALNTSIDDLLCVRGAGAEKVKVLRTFAQTCRFHNGHSRVIRTSEGVFDRVPSLVQSESVENAQIQEHSTQASDLETIAMDLAHLVADKQRQYGDSAGRSGAILRILYPEGVKPDQYDRMLLVVRVLDKLSRLATNKVDLGGESPWRDIMGYALLAVEKGF